VTRYSENGWNMRRKSLTETKPDFRKLPQEFYTRDVLDVAPDLIGKNLIVRMNDNTCRSFQLTEVEAYRGEDDKACHASKGRTERTSVMFGIGGHLYVYLIYGMYWMLNIVTGEKDNPQAVLLRGAQGINGPGKLTRELGIDRSFYGENLVTSTRIWLEDSGQRLDYKTGPRIGIDYAGEYWKSVPWRFYI